ncbi:MBL fold metallo-hydrolase [Methanobrevibacter curvatus]|uniref:Hydroxyacylglutathione hydrolase n=1 Tax=Methanobrevibacter curvatus TaxID=49547 RepID=A0A166A1Z9_9EURY|nr:MBL fold metallo-hydrolase [Methanobrevibacter curvatus]KZX11464.1 hydroxyacylglutathione hydrolase [Methanobrevibacter curvatus]
MEKINDIYYIEGFGADSNSYLIGNIIVDTGTGTNKEYLEKELKKIDYNLNDIDLIINTHCHFDHICGNHFFKEAKIAIGEKDSDALINREKSRILPSFSHAEIEITGVDIKLYESDYIGDILNKNKIEIKNLKNKSKIDEFEVIEIPGHTKGGICLYDGETLISGDTVFTNGGFGRIDLGGDLNDMENSLKRLKDLDVNYLLPGHGPWADNGNSHVQLANTMFESYYK